MRIALFHNLPSGGARRHTLEQLRGLAQRGHEIVEYAPAMADLPQHSFEPVVKERCIYDLNLPPLYQRRIPFATPYIHLAQSFHRLKRTSSVNAQIASDIDDSNFDVVLVKDCQIMPSPYLLRYGRTAKLFQCHHILRPHRTSGTDNNEQATTTERLKLLYYTPARALFRQIHQTDERRNIRSAAAVLVPSRYAGQVLSERYGVEAEVLYPGIDTSLFRPLARSHPSTTGDYVLSVGFLNTFKGYRFLIAALALIDPAIRPALFIAANGRDPKEEIIVRQLAEQQGVRLHVETIADEQRLVDVYNGALLFVYAAAQEALGLSTLEAMACGTPVVAVAEGGPVETVRDNETAFLVERDVKQFAQAVERLLRDRSLREDMGRAASDYVRRCWSWEVAANQLEQRLYQVAAKSR